MFCFLFCYSIEPKLVSSILLVSHVSCVAFAYFFSAGVKLTVVKGEEEGQFMATHLLLENDTMNR